MDDHDDDLGGASGPLPDPLDRIWRHPSELHRAPAGSRRRFRRRSGAQHRAFAGGIGRALVPIGSALAGAGLTFGLLATFGSVEFDARGAQAGAATRRVLDPAAIATRLAPSIVAVTVRDSSGVRRGSGVTLRHGGEVLTNARLVGKANSVSVRTLDGERAMARVVGRDVDADVALLALDAPLVAAPLGDELPGVGKRVYAIGADGSGHATPWMSQGIVASTDGLTATADGPSMSGLIATDALVPSTAAGGALVDDEGRVVGVLLGALENERGGLALPMSFATDVADRLRADGRADHGWLGLQGVDTPDGPLVEDVTAGGPADRAGVEVGDVVLAVDDRTLDTMAEVTAVVRRHWPRERVALLVLRGSVRLHLTVRVGATPTGGAGSTTTVVPVVAR
jgi:S1-C subfamily serine protease